MATTCDYCWQKAKKDDGKMWFTEDIWCTKTWCSHCEEEAAWDIYHDALEEITDDISDEEE